MRLVYLDEAGVSNPQQEPHLVVAGVILNGDQDWQPIDRHLKSICRRFLPEDDRDGFVFHAKDLWHGSGYFKRDVWPRDKRMAIMQEIAGIPNRFHLYVVAGAIDRLAMQDALKKRSPNMGSKVIAAWTHAEAYIKVAADVDSWMQRDAPEEVAMLIAENTEPTKRALKLVHAGFRTDDDEYWHVPRQWRVFTARRIVDTVHFAEKEESSILQVADMCAFVMKRYISGKSDVGSLFNLLKPRITERPESPLHPAPTAVRITVHRKAVEVIE